MAQEDKTRIPGMMRIIAEVAKAADLAISLIMGSERRTGIINARAAVYKLATEYGYPKSEIMWFLDRDRTVGYNYDSNIAGHLSRNSRFIALCAAASQELNKYPQRVEKDPQRQNLTEITAILNETETTTEKARTKEPVFKSWKGKLGWSFAAEEERRAWYACRAAWEFMQDYGQAPGTRKPKTAPAVIIPPEMPTIDAALYLGIAASTLTKGVQLGYLNRYNKPKDSSYWYSTPELDHFKIYLSQNKRRKK